MLRSFPSSGNRRSQSLLDRSWWVGGSRDRRAYNHRIKERDLDNSNKVSEAQLERLIPNFYARVRDDALIGPVFGGAIGDWQQHLAKLVDFWSSVMLTSE